MSTSMANLKPNYLLTIRNYNYQRPYIQRRTKPVDESRLVFWKLL